MTLTNETDRNADFRAYPGFSDYLACMLQDLQYREMDESCTDEREERDSGTIYTLTDDTYQAMFDTYRDFSDQCRDAIAQAVNLVPGEDGLRYASDRYMTHERIGSTLWLAQCGSGVGFTDDGDAPCLVTLDAWACSDGLPRDVFFGDDGKVYLS